MNTLGAPAALHGYRVQALYTLKRIITQANNELVFSPEGLEDLDILNKDKNLLELVQVKKYSPLQLSDLTPAKENSFFRRALNALDNDEIPRIKLVNFGNIGPELHGAWNGNSENQANVRKKLKGHDFTDNEITVLFDSIELIGLDEDYEEATLEDLLRELHVGIDPPNGLDLLHYWIFISMENRQEITYSDFVSKLNSVGRWLAARRDYHDQWFTSIQPIEPNDNIEDRYEFLQKEFFEGGYTTFDHITAELDFQRPNKLGEIKTAFEKSNVVIIHAASGQGKTTLALRFIHDYYPNGWRFSITRIENTQHALSVANALSGYANAIQAPLVVFIDVAPIDTDWTELARRLSRHPYLQILIAIREEDYRRSNVPTANFSFEEIDLSFNEVEAEIIFNRAQSLANQERFLDFAAAWDTFGGQGPLLEFVYFITQTESLHQRLENQINRIRDEVRSKQLEPNELHLLRLVAVATAFEARVSTTRFIKALELPEPSRTLDFYQNEFLIRLSEAGYIEGLHAIRSEILVELLTDKDINLWADLAQEIVPYLVDEDIEIFILYTALKRSEHIQQVYETITHLYPTTWRGIAGILRGLLWLDINKYVADSKPAIDAAIEEFGAGWFFIANLNLPNEDGPDIENWWERDGISSLFSAERIARLNAIQAMLPFKENMFINTKLWLEKVNVGLDAPVNLLDWNGAAFTLYWAAYLQVCCFNTPSPKVNIPLFTLADVTYALYKYASQEYAIWQNNNEPQLLSRLASELDILYLDKNKKHFTIHFLVTNNDVSEREGKDPLHEITSERLLLVRQLFPEFETYGIQGYGHKLGEVLQLDFDSTQKSGVDRRNLVPSLVTWANQIATGIARYSMRLDTWHEYAGEILIRRRSILLCLNQLYTGLLAYVSSRKEINIGEEYITREDWETCFSLLDLNADLPKPSVDPWGFASESIDNASLSFSMTQNQTSQHNYIPEAITLQTYKPFLQALRKFFLHIKAFMEQSISVTVVNFNLSKLDDRLEKAVVEAELKNRGFDIDGAQLCTHNLWDAKRWLSEFQEQFKDLFGDHVESLELRKIDEEELQLFEDIWPLWYHYAHKPTHTIRQNPQSRVARFVINEKRVIDRWINNSLSRFSNNQRKAERLVIELDWKEKSALVINLDVTIPLDVTEAFLDMIKTLHSQFRVLRSGELKSFIIQESYEQIVVIPTFQGRMVNNNAWTLYTLSTILNPKPVEEHSWVSYQMNPLDSEWLKQVGLEFWLLPQIELANRISAIVSGLMIITSQIAEFVKLPKANEPGTELLQEYLTERSDTLNELLKDFDQLHEDLLSQNDSISKNEKASRHYLNEAITLIAEIYEATRPVGSSDTNKHQLDLDDVLKYSQRISSVFLDAEKLRLLLISDAIIYEQK